MCWILPCAICLCQVFPPFLSFNFSCKILFHPQRITIPEILEDDWFKKGYKPPVFKEKYETSLDDVDAVFKDAEVSQRRASPIVLLQVFLLYLVKAICHMKHICVLLQEHHVTEKKEEQPTTMNAFELISMSKGLDLGNLFDTQQVNMLDFSSLACFWCCSLFVKLLVLYS